MEFPNLHKNISLQFNYDASKKYFVANKICQILILGFGSILTAYPLSL